jgi:alpha-glucosidase
MELLDMGPDVVAWRRGGAAGAADRLVAVNMGSSPAAVDLAGTVLVASDGAGEGTPFPGSLGPDRAVLIEPA